MIITNVIGGIGNQMFQFAHGLSISLDTDRPLRLDVSEFDNYSLHHGYELSRVFVGPFVTATQSDIDGVLGWRGKRYIKKLLARRYFKSIRPNRFFIEENLAHSEAAKFNEAPVYIQGYWQSEKYFIRHELAVREAFIFKNTLDYDNAELAERINTSNAVAVHIRRGDYVSNKQTNRIHGLCSIQYFQKAIEEIIKKVEKPSFFIFSDDINWVKKNIVFPKLHVYVENNIGLRSYIDMHLMSLCKHHIISNSSFSWWGAWLKKTAGFTIAPFPWFAKQTLVDDSLIPDYWTKLKK